MARISSLCEKTQKRSAEETRGLAQSHRRAEGPLVNTFHLSAPGQPCESGMRENRTYRLSGGRRRALRWAPPPTRHRRSGGIEPTRPRGGKGAPAGGTGGGKDGQHTAVGSRLHVTTTDSRTGQTSRRDGGGHRLASWTRGYATARSEAICRGAGCGRTRTSGSVGGQGQQRPWSTRPPLGRRSYTVQGT